MTRIVELIDKYLRIFNESDLDYDKSFCVTRKGGSIGDNKGQRYKGETLISTHDTIEDARAEAKRRNSHLTKGEKGYYGIKHRAQSFNKKYVSS